jgi:hypothetical protein
VALGEVEFDGDVLFSLSGLVELTLSRSLFVLAPGVAGVVLLFGEVTPGVLGVVLSGCAPGVVAELGLVELPAPGVPGDVLGV